MSSNNSQVVVGYDFSRSARQALYRAIGLATRAPFHILHFVCVIDPHVPFAAVPTKHVDYEYAERVQRVLAEEIGQELRDAKVADRVHFFVHARIGHPVAEILGVARDVGADLILVGTKGLTGVERVMLGSVAEKIVREAQCTVEVVRPKTYEYVELLDIVDAKEHGKYIAPHRYTYENHVLNMRPTEWPIY
jgi:nucleotide-binding universal stress UspA family protein